LLVVDGGAALLAALAVAETRPHPMLAVALLLAVVTLNARACLQRPPAVPLLLDELPAVCARIAVSWCALAALTAAFAPAYALPAHALLLGCALQSAVGCAGRGTVHWLCRRALSRRPAAALVVGPAATAQHVATAFLRHPRFGLRPVGVVDLRQPSGGDDGLPVLTTPEEVQRALIQNGVRTVLSVAGDGTEHASLLAALAASGCALWEVDTEPPAHGTPAAYAPCPPHRTRGERLAGFVCRRLDGTGPALRIGTAVKRALDVLVSGTLLLLVSPLLLGFAAVLRLTDGPGVVFRQERIGKDGRPFTLLKLRTHRPVDAQESATRWSVAGEVRMNPFCRFLRRSSLDELLQLWNVFRGDMSLVGPRPERPYFVGQFSQTYPGYAARHRMPVGITGLSQISGLRGDTSIEDRARFDNAYIDDWSLWQDVCILLRTAVALVRPTGS
jgi:exopolysaccharide biosynthesis polyprenyl glycosylphosphotransferase